MTVLVFGICHRWMLNARHLSDGQARQEKNKISPNNRDFSKRTTNPCAKKIDAKPLFPFIMSFSESAIPTQKSPLRAKLAHRGMLGIDRKPLVKHVPQTTYQ